MAIRYYLQTFHTRAFRKEPVRTIARGIRYEIMRRLDLEATISCAFGPHRFVWNTKGLPAKYGSAGFFVMRKYYEPLMEFGHTLIKPGDVVVDGGANQGVFTCAFASAVGESGGVFAFEPLSYAFRRLQRNVELNGFSNCVLYNGALSDRAGEAVIDSSIGPVSASITRDFGGRCLDRVVTTTVDKACASTSRLDFVKLDVEGAELATLRGARESIASHRPIVVVEAGNKEEYGPVRDYLAGFGYRPHIFDESGRLIPTGTAYAFNFNVIFLPENAGAKIPHLIGR